MPKWSIALIAAVLAGLIGFACGLVLTKPKRQETDTRIEAAKNQAALLQTENQQLKQQLAQATLRATPARPSNPSCIFELPKPELIAYCQSKGFEIGPQPYMNQDGLTHFPLESSACLRLSWLEPEYQKLAQILVSNTGVSHSKEGLKPCFDAWERLCPELVPLFREANQEKTRGAFCSGRQRYHNSAYAYGVSENNKLFAEHVGK